MWRYRAMHPDRVAQSQCQSLDGRRRKTEHQIALAEAAIVELGLHDTHRVCIGRDCRARIRPLADFASVQPNKPHNTWCNECSFRRRR